MTESVDVDEVKFTGYLTLPWTVLYNMKYVTAG